jgi:hypothetical protein
LHRIVDVFIDESGDLGFQRELSSNFLVICATATVESYKFARITKKAHKKMKVKGKGAIEFKFNKSNESLRNHFLDKFNGTESWIAWGAINKFSTNEELRLDHERLYNTLCGKVIADLLKHIHAKKLRIIFDKKGTKSCEETLNHYLTKIVESNHSGYFPPSLRISHLDSTKNEGLQVHDFVTGAIFQFVERGNDTYLKKIENKICSGKIY